MVYLDNSATTQVDPDVAERAKEMMLGDFGNPSSLHYLGAQAYSQLNLARNQLAKVISARTSCIYFTSGGTESNNLAIQGGARSCTWGGRHIVTTAIEHDSILKACGHMEEEGWSVTYVSPDPETHRITAQAVIDAVREDTALVSVMYVNNETGDIQPIQEIVAGVRAKNPRTLIHCDCVQGFGKVPFKLHVYDVDMVSASSHKIHGPKGIGMIYLRRPEMIRPLKFGGKQEGCVNPGTESVPLACAFGLAADKALYRIEENWTQANAVRSQLLQALQETFPKMRVNSPQQDYSPYILNVAFPGAESHKLVSFLSLRQIYVSAGSACTKGAPSHVLKAMHYGEDVVSSSIRISLSRYTTVQDAMALVDALRDFPGLQ